MKTRITRAVRIDAGHRIPNHNSKCRNVHGHSYTFEATIVGTVNTEKCQPDEGMVLDFSLLTKILKEQIHDKWDHGFLVYAGDTDLIAALKILGAGHKTVVLNKVPTAENLAKIAFEMVGDRVDSWSARLGSERHITLVNIRVYETPNCWADYPGE